MKSFHPTVAVADVQSLCWVSTKQLYLEKSAGSDEQAALRSSAAVEAGLLWSCRSLPDGSAWQGSQEQWDGLRDTSAEY